MVNHLVIGTKSDGFLFTFKNVEWKPGTISAVGYDVNDKQVCSDEINTVGAPVALRLTQIKRPTDFVADGHDLGFGGSRSSRCKRQSLPNRIKHDKLYFRWSCRMERRNGNGPWKLYPRKKFSGRRRSEQVSYPVNNKTWNDNN